MLKKIYLLLFLFLIGSCSQFYETNELIVPPIARDELLKKNETNKKN